MLQTLATVLMLVACAAGRDNSAPGTVQWAEGGPNCTFRAGDDGHTYYGLSSGDFEIELSVDRQELEKVPHRAVRVLGVFVSFRYQGNGELETHPNKIALEFVQHRQVVHTALVISGLLTMLQHGVDEITYQAEKQAHKHSGDNQKEEAELQSRLKDYKEMMDFIPGHALHSTTLDATHPSISGWVFFSTEDRWIGSLHPPEQFVLRLPVENLIVEFPFQLPPKGGKMELRRRPGS